MVQASVYYSSLVFQSAMQVYVASRARVQGEQWHEGYDSTHSLRFPDLLRIFTLRERESSIGLVYYTVGSQHWARRPFMRE